MDRGFAELKAVSLVKSTRVDIVNRGAQPKSLGHQLLRKVEQNLTDPLSLRAGRDKNLIETFGAWFQGKKPDQPTGLILILCKIERPTRR